MTLARSLLYQALYGIWAVLMSFAFLPSLILPFWASRFIAWFWTASVFALLKATTGLTHRIEGAENIPDGPVIFASKHQSTWETMIYPYILRDPVTILKRELFWIPFYGWSRNTVASASTGQTAPPPCVEWCGTRGKPLPPEGPLSCSLKEPARRPARPGPFRSVSPPCIGISTFRLCRWL